MLDPQTFFVILASSVGTTASIVKFLIDWAKPWVRRRGWSLDWRAVAHVLSFALAAIAVPVAGLTLADPQGIGLFILAGFGGAQSAMKITDQHDISHNTEPGT